MTTLLPTQDLAMLRAIARTASVLLVALRVDQLYPGRAISDMEIADILEADPRTVKKQLRSLSAAGLVLEQRESRYVVTVAGRNTLFGFAGHQEFPQPTSLSIEEGKITGETIELRAQNVLHDDDDDDIKSESDSESSSSITERTKCAKLLEATHLLFSNGSVNADGITARDPNWVLAWIAKAYVDRRNLTNPQGLVYSRLLKNVRPPLQYLKNASGFLPEKYLVEVGLLEKPTAEPELEIVAPDSEYDGIGRHRGWLDLLSDPAIPGIKGVAFMGNERVQVVGQVMTVSVRQSFLRGIAEHKLSEVFSKIYAEQTEQSDARVEFVAAETEAAHG
jgi:hypothetical protein